MNKFKKRRLQRGFIEITILAAFIFFAVAGVSLKYFSFTRMEKAIASQADSVRVFRNALQDYTRLNIENFRQGKEIMYVVDQYKPTVDELRKLGFLSTAGYDMASQFGTPMKAHVWMNDDYSVNGFVYITSSIIGKNGLPDNNRACAIARSLGDIGICSVVNDPQSIGNSKLQGVNPVGVAGIVGALIYVN